MPSVLSVLSERFPDRLDPRDPVQAPFRIPRRRPRAHIPFFFRLPISFQNKRARPPKVAVTGRFGRHSASSSRSCIFASALGESAALVVEHGWIRPVYTSLFAFPLSFFWIPAGDSGLSLQNKAFHDWVSAWIFFPLDVPMSHRQSELAISELAVASGEVLALDASSVGPLLFLHITTSPLL